MTSVPRASGERTSTVNHEFRRIVGRLGGRTLTKSRHPRIRCVTLPTQIRSPIRTNPYLCTFIHPSGSSSRHLVRLPRPSACHAIEVAQCARRPELLTKPVTKTGGSYSTVLVLIFMLVDMPRASNGPYYSPYKVNRNGHVFSTNVLSFYDTYTYLSSSLSPQNRPIVQYYASLEALDMPGILKSSIADIIVKYGMNGCSQWF
ncbi:uncharacterized protein BDR25DRAFT_358952 [Lindgomyces ingoldianus]|uniref:Uncharacterized protein n=1 Tax=Lindgomyces ingoldianus TaxID=673940 RepID=A0ACB6QJ24_9PLEO|nr:uncharacterized protein BDR25DRAFT_358952 [Lindgomyces ingoldianus]KAF2466890.1 hypothetical protein BDR25DRAFT_358952 [Lindgomyces ingoldianus]